MPEENRNQPARREFLGSLVAGTASAGMASAAAAPARPRPGSLFDKMYGCIAGVYIGSAMGVPVESWDYRRIKEKYGVLKGFVPHQMYDSKEMSPPGTTEDGVERIKYICMAIIEKKDRITADDLVATWLKVITEEKFEAMRHTTEGFDRELMLIARTRTLPPAMLGTLVKYSHLNTTVRCTAPLAMINACDPEGAVLDLYDVCRVYQPLTSDGYLWGASYLAALAHAFRPDATVASTVDTALAYAHPSIKGQLQRALNLAKKTPDPMDIRVGYERFYSGRGATNYFDSFAEETGSKALTVFSATKGNFSEAMTVSINFGRDTDCLAASACALVGALSGASGIPADWISTVDAATQVNPNTNSKLTIRETAEGIYGALENKIRKMREHAAQMETYFKG